MDGQEDCRRRSREKGLGKKTAAAKRREKALVTNNKIFKIATGKRALRAKTGLQRVSMASVGVLDRRVQSYLTQLCSKIKALTADRRTDSIRAEDVQTALRHMDEGPKNVYGCALKTDNMPFQKGMVAKFVRAQTPGKRWEVICHGQGLYCSKRSHG